MTSFATENLLPPTVIKTTTLQAAVQKTWYCLENGTIIAFDGEPGLGKTTTAAYACQETATEVSWCYGALPIQGGTKDIISTIYERLLGPSDGLRRRAMERLIVDRLTDLDVGLVVDEVHGCGFRGLQQVRHLHDEVRERTGRGFPLILAGVGIYGYLRKVPEVRGRVASWTFFVPLEGNLKLEFASKIHPRLAKTTPKRLTQLSNFADGHTLRGWTTVAMNIDLLESTRQHPTAPLSQRDVDSIEAMVY